MVISTFTNSHFQINTSDKVQSISHISLFFVNAGQRRWYVDNFEVSNTSKELMNVFTVWNLGSDWNVGQNQIFEWSIHLFTWMQRTGLVSYKEWKRNISSWRYVMQKMKSLYGSVLILMILLREAANDIDCSGNIVDLRHHIIIFNWG